MSRSILIRAKYKNNQSVVCGIYNPRNYETSSSRFSQKEEEELERKIEVLKKEIGERSVKEFNVTINASPGSSAIPTFTLRAKFATIEQVEQIIENLFNTANAIK